MFGNRLNIKSPISYAVLVVIGLFVGCSGPELTKQQRKEDIQFLADWADKYSPFVQANGEFKVCPDYKELLPQYLDYAENAEDNKQFLYVVMGYFHLVCNTGHSFIFNQPQLPWSSRYWAILYNKHCTTQLPFRISRSGQDFFLNHDWKTRQGIIPRGSRILEIDGLSCSQHLEHLHQTSWWRYLPAEKWFTRNLFGAKESEDFKGWNTDFLLPDGRIIQAFVPCRAKPAFDNSFTDFANENCICIELNDSVGYVRIKSFLQQYVHDDHNEIRQFLAEASRKYTTLIIDVRNHPGGSPQYYLENLIQPLIKDTVSYSLVTGIKRRFISDNTKEYIDGLHAGVSGFISSVEEVESPAGYDNNDWIFFKVTRTIPPKEPYDFDGQVYALVNDGSSSAAEGYAIAAKNTGCAKLAGTNTPGGAAPYLVPFVIALPNSKMHFVVEGDMVINPDGTIEEIEGTAPDIALEPALIPDTPSELSREIILEDKWVKTLMELPTEAGS